MEQTGLPVGMKTMPGRLTKIPPAALFYAVLFLGNLLFAGRNAALALTLVLFLSNGILRAVIGAFIENSSAVISLTVRSLLALGLFPLAWLICRGLAGSAGSKILAGLLGIGFLFSVIRKAPGNETEGRDKRWILIAFLLVTVLAWYPFSRIGFPINGSYAYRAYFSSDYLKHFSVVETLNQSGLPPANLYFQGEVLHYYWLPYATPAFVAFFAGSTAKAMFAFSFTVNFLFLLLLSLMAARTCLRRRWMPYLAALMVLAPSLEGLYLWAVRAHFSWSGYFRIGRNVNIDGLTRWLWNLPQVDTLLRALLFTPQHLLSLAFLLLFLYVLSQKNEHPWALSFCLASSLAASFFVGGILLVSWGLYTTLREAAKLIRGQLTFGSFFMTLARHFALPAFVLGLSFGLKMITFNGSGIMLKPVKPGEAFVLLGLNLGLLTCAGVAGLLAGRFQGRAFHALLLIVSLTLILVVRISNFESDVSLKAGLVAILVLTLLTCRLAETPRAGRIALPAALLIILPGLWTLALDVRNSSDIRNRSFTSYVSFEEMRMLDWLRENIPGTRTVQNFPEARPWNLSAIPAFSGRQMVVGDRMHGQIFQVRPDLYQRRVDDLRRALAGLPATLEDLRRMGVDYLFWGQDERRHFNFKPRLPVAKRMGTTVLYSLIRPTIQP
ncbi:MAG: hypothetical protein PHX05_09335 [Acidobacteriota bacterium]|nr:hypothetical protein [Acidobacteriota bacterium]